MKETFVWHSLRLERELRVVRWGHWGRPVLLYPTAGGDAEECERFLMVKALESLIDAGRVKLYSVDSVAGAAWMSGEHPVGYCSLLQNRFDAAVYHEVVAAIRRDCQSPEATVVSAGASIGAFNALAVICRHPDAFDRAICMSGTYDLSRWLGGEWNLDFYFSSPIHFLPGLGEGAELELLRRRFILLPTGEGPWEDPGESWRMAAVLGAKGIPNRVDPWGPEYEHDWPTWRRMLPHYLGQLTAD